MKIKNNRALLELWIGVVFFGALCFLGVLFVPSRLIYCICLSIGIIVALATTYYMWWSLDRSLALDEDSAIKNARIHYLVRYFALAVVLILVGIFFGSYVLATFAGILGIKVSAYLQPIINRLLSKINEK